MSNRDELSAAILWNTQTEQHEAFITDLRSRLSNEDIREIYSRGSLDAFYDDISDRMNELYEKHADAVWVLVNDRAEMESKTPMAYIEKKYSPRDHDGFAWAMVETAIVLVVGEMIGEGEDNG